MLIAGRNVAYFGASNISLAQVIAAIFPSGSDGVVNDYADLLSIRQENTGLTAGAVGSSAGLVLDERQTIGSELATNTSITGNAASGSTQTYSTGAAITGGKTYQISADVTGYSGTGTVGFASTAIGAAYTISANGHLSGIKTAAAGGTISMFTSAANTCNFSNISVKEITGSHASQATSSARPVETAFGTYTGLLFDGGDDALATSVGGGGTAGFFWCGAVKVISGDGTTRSIWSDVGTNTGYRVRIPSTNKLALGAGNGTAYTSATTTDDVLAGNTYVLTLQDDGVNLTAQVNRGAIASVARPVVSAGGAGFSIGKDNNGATSFCNMALFAQVYRKNGGVSDADRLKAQRWCASKAGISI
jgi:hypothetical protein